jgi:hypothetical protein
MKDKLLHIFRTKPFFLFLLPLFWVLHGVVENFGLIPLKDASFLLLFYLGIAVLFSLLLWLVYRDFKKANLVAFLLLCGQLFFGSLQDFSKDHFANSFLSKYSFLVPFLLIIIIISAILVKKKKATFYKTCLYLNTVFTILILIDGISAAIKASHPPRLVATSNIVLQPCPGCKKPDIYLILADAYAGHIELQDLFGFDNSPFENELRKRGFHITDSTHSNYNFTGFSMASMLSMNYLEGIRKSNSDKNDIFIYSRTIKQSIFPVFLQNQGYEFYNYSIFDFEGNPSPIIPTFLPNKTRLITSQTFTRRIIRDLGYHLATTFKIPSVIKQYKTSDKRNNELLFDKTWNIAGKAGKPKFVYTHLMMPHHPFFYDSLGNELPIETLVDGHYYDKAARISYLKYANKKLLALIDHILATSASPPIIILMGDHGFREFTEKIDTRYIYMNLNAVLLPDGNYSGFYKGQSNINQLRILLNTEFHQRLPMLRDSTIFIDE